MAESWKMKRLCQGRELLGDFSSKGENLCQRRHPLRVAVICSRVCCTVPPASQGVFPEGWGVPAKKCKVSLESYKLQHFDKQELLNASLYIVNSAFNKQI